ncbi:hypothetical protein [Microbacterium sp. bgisy189]|uniref:hypothetical protein n=1 Tax=Microbacterium sp. bgisy189 TaxID=3413798 RepID=UPI003EB72BA2
MTDDVTVRPDPISPTDANPESFTFVPYVRAGAAAGITARFTEGMPARATMHVQVTVEDGAGGTELVDTTDIVVRGPGDVTGIDPAQVIRRYPQPGTGSASTADLVHVEFDQPDLPWMFTPAAPVDGRLPPWLRLVVVPTDSIRADLPPAGAELPPVIRVPVAELPPPEEGWAWAHAQLSGADLNEAALVGRAGSGSPALNLSRLLCPRRLEPNRAWTALVVPAFQPGVRAAFGAAEPPGETLAWSWGSGGGTADLPFYDRWEFATGDPKDFEQLAEDVEPVPPPPGIGRRLVDTTHPGAGIDASATGGPRHVRGALVRAVFGPEPEPVSNAGVWDATVTDPLRAIIDPPADDGDPVVGPPLYGGAHLQRDRVPAAGAEPAWLVDLALDPADRIAAALGAAVVRMDQEDLMAGAWSQLENVRAANAVLRAAQLSLFAQTSLHARSLGRMAPGAVLGVTARAHAHLAGAPGATARGVVGASALPPAAIGATARRLVRPLGRAARFGAVEERADRAVAVIADGDTGADWVLPIAGPRTAGIRGALDALERGDLDPVVSAVEDAPLQGLLDALDALPTPEEVGAIPGHPDDDPEGELIATALALAFGIVATRNEWAVPGAAIARFPDAGVSADDPGPFEQDLLTFRVLMPIWDALAGAGFSGYSPYEPGDRPDGGEQQPLPGTVIEAFGEAVLDADEPVELARPRLDLAALDLVGKLRPALTVPRRVATRLPGLAALLGRPEDAIDTVMVAPEFRHPLYEALSRYDQEWLMPGVAAISKPDMVTALQTNGRFVQSFLTGANHEFARELVWREYPTDGRGTSLARFWTPAPDLRPLHTLTTGGLGEGIDPLRSGKLVLVVRGEVVRRFPHLLAIAAQGRAAQGAVRGYPVDYHSPVTELFRIALVPNLLLVGIDLTASAVSAADATVGAPPPDGAYWFTLGEHVGAPRFGLDEADPRPEPRTRDELGWADWAPLVGAHLPATLSATVRTVVDTPEPDVYAGAYAGRPATSALLAWTLFQKPSRMGFRLAQLLGRMEAGDG